MAPTQVSSTAMAIREEAARLFFVQGYDATSLRQAPSAVGIQVGSLYNHIGSKEDLLQQIIGGIIDELLRLQQEALNATGGVIKKLRAVLDCHIRFHTERAQEVFIGNAELRSLSQEARQVIIDKRSQYENIIATLIDSAGDVGLVSVIDSRIHTFSLVAQTTHIAGWYKPGGRMTLDEIVEAYTRMALRELNTPGADERANLVRA